MPEQFATKQLYLRWKPITAGGIELFSMATVPVTGYGHRGSNIPSRWLLNPALRQDPRRARCVERRTAGSASGLETDPGQPGHRAPGRLNWQAAVLFR
jgi:hypothetical protein